MRRRRAVTVLAVAMAVVATPTVASAEQGYGGGGVSTVAEGLDGPRQLNSFTNGRLVVAESDSGEVSSVDPRTGQVRALIGGLPTPQGVDYRDGLLFIATGEQAPDEPPSPEVAAESRSYGTKGCQASPTAAPSSLIVARPNGQIVKRWDLLCYELRNNPDRQPFEQEDAVSNPFSVHVQANRILVADAGANAVLAIDRRTNKISTFFVPPLVPTSQVPECAGRNPAGFNGCDSVPTGVTQDKHGNIYVSTLGSDVPGAGRVYVLSPAGKVLKVIKNLDPLTGIAVDSYGNVFVSELFAGAPPGPPPASEEEAEPVGQVVKITPRGARSYAQVTLPTGLEINGGKLYASAWSIAIFFGAPSRGEVVRVSTGAFAAAPN